MGNQNRAAQFRELHDRRPLVLPNAWDAASARVLELAGAAAIGTTSAGVSWTLGRADGEQLRRDEMLEAIARIVRAVGVPVTADVEGGYGDGSADAVDETVRALVNLGAAGINLEDSSSLTKQLLSPSVHAQRLAAARAAGGDLVINARIDVFLFAVGTPETRIGETVRRAASYRAAGADCIFVPGVTDPATIAALVRAIELPVNIMAQPGAPSVSELGRLGVARVSVGPLIAQAALAATLGVARTLLEQGTYGRPEELLSFDIANALFDPELASGAGTLEHAAAHDSDAQARSAAVH
ncbi:MAG TPA: isocitrate lyase/phosphoenolpyruvate mutase family protein [Gemmatimonadaceae bacterium]